MIDFSLLPCELIATMIFRLLILCFSLTFFYSIDLSAQSEVYKKSISVAELQQDFEILKKVLLDYHPGLYRYQDSATIANLFEDLDKVLDQNLSSREFYLLLSEFTTKLKCGHTFCSYYNQKKEIQEVIFNQKDKLPFTFFLFEEKMFIDKNLSQGSLPEGSQVLSINDIPVSTIMDKLLTYAKGDGSNNGKRLLDLELTGLGKYEAFDIYFPLLFPAKNSTYDIKIKELGTDEIAMVNVKCIGRTERFNLIEQKFAKQNASYDDLWSFELLDKSTAHLKIGTFVTYKMTLDWKAFLAEAFQEMKDKNIANLILDIRGNEGGSDDVSLVLAKYLASKPIDLPAFKEVLRYEKVSDELRPYLKTWDKNFYNRSGKLIKQANGFYTWKKNQKPAIIKQNKKAFSGKVVLLVNAANSSATFFLTKGLQDNKLATVIGSETGGNRKGTNGGNLFFLNLPNSNIEIDIPLIGYYPLEEQEDKGLTPDIEVRKTIEDILGKNDPVLEKALDFIARK